MTTPNQDELTLARRKQILEAASAVLNQKQYQDRQKLDRQNQILEAATTVFAEKGFQRATIKDIAKVAGIADGTIYNYFQNKIAILLGLLDRLNETETRAMHFEGARDTNFNEFFAAYLKHRLEQFGPREIALFGIVISEVLVNAELREQYQTRIIEPTFALGERAFQAMIDAGQIPAMDVQIWMRMITATILGLIVQRLFGDTTLEERWDSLPDVLPKLLLEGLLHQERKTP
jgi:AcrR family transcriptional regulator